MLIEEINKALLEMKGITKLYTGVKALDNVDFEILPREIHVLCGENGAGKSTLIKIIAGVIQPTSGEILLEGETIKLDSPAQAEKNGISIVYQELCLSPTVSVAENIFLGAEKTYGMGIINKRKSYDEAKRLLNLLNCDINPQVLVNKLTVAQQQLVQIAKALSVNPKILIMDEPFSALSSKDTENLFEIMMKLRKDGVAIIYIDHLIDNFTRIGDRITVLRDGKKVGVKSIKETTKEEIVKMMVGRDIDSIYPKYNKYSEELFFEMCNVTTNSIKNISFNVKKGEIFGLGGLVGAGRTEIMKAIFGIDKIHTGNLFMNGKTVKINGPVDAISRGIAYVPEDRKRQGLFLERSVIFNGSIVSLSRIRKFLGIDSKKERKLLNSIIDSLKIKVSNINSNVEFLSGGNQQKLLFGRWLIMDNTKLLLLDEPTRGIDVGAKHEIYQLINDLANKGMSVILITSELPELLGLCDRIAIIRSGEIAGILDKREMSQERLMNLCV